MVPDSESCAYMLHVEWGNEGGKDISVKRTDEASRREIEDQPEGISDGGPFSYVARVQRSIAAICDAKAIHGHVASGWLRKNHQLRQPHTTYARTNLSLPPKPLPEERLPSNCVPIRCNICITRCHRSVSSYTRSQMHTTYQQGVRAHARTARMD